MRLPGECYRAAMGKLHGDSGDRVGAVCAVEHDRLRWQWTTVVVTRV